MRLVGHADTQKKCIKMLVRKHEGKRQFWRPRCRWEINIKIGPKKHGMRQFRLD